MIPQSSCTILDAPYYWANSAKSSAKNYLKPWIDHALQISGKQKVDIIAHSMGGIVARSYIQNEDLYENDIRKFAMVGTPNQGAPFAYLVWEDGNTEEADNFAIAQNPDSDTFESRAKSYFYTNSVANFMKTKWNQNACRNADDSILNAFQKPSDCNNQLIKRFVQEHVIGLRDLLPTYNGAIDNLNNNSMPYIENNDLILLNQDLSKYDTIDVLLLAGIGKGTLDSVTVDSQGTPVYNSLEPANSNQSGDGTVPRKSILFPELVLTDNTDIGVESGFHGSLPGIFRQKIINYISL